MSSQTSSPLPRQAETHSVLAQFRSGLKTIADNKWMFGLFGTVCVLIYFWRIRYLPQLNIVDIGLVAGAILMFSLLGIVVFVALLFTPGFAYIGWVQQGILPRAPRPANGRTRADMETSSSRANKPPQNGAMAKRTAKYKRQRMRSIFLILALAYISMALAYGLYALSQRLPKDSQHFAVSALILAAAAVTFSSMFITDITRGGRKRPIHKWWPVIFLACATMLYTLVAPITSIAFGVMAPNFRGTTDTEAIISMLLLPLAHLSVYIFHRLSLGKRAIFVAVVAVYVVLSTGLFFNMIDRGAENFRIGMMPDQTLLVSAQGCQIAKAAGIGSGYQQVASSPSRLFAVKNVFLLTRLGSHVVIASPGWTSKRPTTSVALPAADVLSYFKPNNDGEAGATAPASEVTATPAMTSEQCGERVASKST
jgi:hypothetical protein